MQSLNIYWASYVPGDGATKVRKTQSLPRDRSTETNKKAIPSKCWEREAHGAKEVLPHPNHAGRFFWRRGVPLLWKGKQSQAEEPKVRGEGNNGISGRARASLKAKESDVFVELEVAQCKCLKCKGSETWQWWVTRLQVHVCQANQADFPGLCERMGCHLPPTTLSGSANVSVKG